MSGPEVLVLGGGIVGCACALVLAEAGAKVQLVEAQGLGCGTTAAGMGHLVVLDGDPLELAFTQYALARWRERVPALGPGLEWDPCGTLWLAEDEAQWTLAGQRHRGFQALGVASELVEGQDLRRLEPCLAPNLRGALRVPGDGVLYPPAAARLLAQGALAAGARILTHRPVAALASKGVRLADGSLLEADHLVLALGGQTTRLLSATPVVPRKGHLLVSRRQPGFLRHQLVELGYLNSAHGTAGDSVAFNLQPRPTGQLLLGSSRSYGDLEPDLRPEVLRRMVARALAFVPDLGSLEVLRAWTGFRPATPDHRPLLGPVPGRPGLWLATGHEGLGITTALASADLLAAQLLGQAPPFDPTPYLPSRFPELPWCA